MKESKKVMVFGTFDIFHPGHFNFLEQAKSYGDYLIVVIARDVNVLKIKGSLPKFKESIRKKSVASFKIVDKTVFGDKIKSFKVIERNNPDIVCLGYDQDLDGSLEQEIKERFTKIKVFTLKPYHPNKFKTSKIIK